MDQIEVLFQKPLSQPLLIIEKISAVFQVTRSFFLDPYLLQASLDSLLLFLCPLFLLPLPLLPWAPLLAILKADIQCRGKAGAGPTTETDQYIDAHFSSPGLILGAFWEVTVIEHGQYSSLSLSSFSHLSIHSAILCRVISIILILNWGIWGSERWDNMSMITHLIISKANMHLNATSLMICIPNHW